MQLLGIMRKSLKNGIERLIFLSNKKQRHGRKQNNHASRTFNSFLDDA